MTKLMIIVLALAAIAAAYPVIDKEGGFESDEGYSHVEEITGHGSEGGFEYHGEHGSHGEHEEHHHHDSHGEHEEHHHDSHGGHEEFGHHENGHDYIDPSYYH